MLITSRNKVLRRTALKDQQTKMIRIGFDITPGDIKIIII